MRTIGLKVLGVALGVVVMWSAVSMASAKFDLLKVGDKAPAFTASAVISVGDATIP